MRCVLHLLYPKESVPIPIGYEDERKRIWTQYGCDGGEKMPVPASILLLYWPNYSSCTLLVVNFENKYCFCYFQIG
jgi:hypothetical protein